MNKGAFQTSREIFENPIWEDVPKFRIFFYIYGKAVFSKEGTSTGGIKINRGQFLRSYRNLREDLQYIENRSIKKYSLSMISRKIDQLVKENRLKIEDTELGTLFTVVNYSNYQGLSNYKKDNENAERTEKEQTKNGVGTEQEQNENNNKNVKNDLKDSTTAAENDAIVFYQNNIGMIRPIIAEEMIDWIDDFGDEMVIEALNKSIAQNKANWGYAKAILKSWHDKGIKTVEQANAEEIEFKNRQQSRFRPQQKPEIVPDWFENRNRKVEEQPQQDPKQSQAEKDEIDEMLKQYT